MQIEVGKIKGRHSVPLIYTRDQLTDPQSL